MAREDAHILESFQKHGWHAIAVTASDRAPAHSYTVGLQHSFAHPEIIVFGLDPHFAHVVLWDLVQQVQTGHSYAEHERYRGIWRGRLATFIGVHRTQFLRYLSYAASFSRRVGNLELEALQLLWADSTGYLPGSELCEDCIAKLQPRLDLEACPDDLAAFMLDA